MNYFKIDTRAEANLPTFTTVNSIAIIPKLLKCKTELTTYIGDDIPIIKTCISHVVKGGKLFSLLFAVTEPTSVLGTSSNYSLKLNLIKPV